MKVVNYLIRMIRIAAVYGFIIWLFNVIFDKEYSFSRNMLLQTIVFSVIVVLWSELANHKKVKK